MKFSNLSRRLADYAGQGSITQEEALSLISRLCDDVRFETGASVDRCQVQNWDRLVDELYAIGNTVNTLYEKHKTTILELDQTDTEDALWQKLRAAEAGCRQAKEQLGKLEGVRRELSQAEEDLQRQVSAERELLADESQRRQRISLLEQELAQLRGGDLEALACKCQALEEEKRQALAQRRELENQLQARELELAPLREALRNCQSQVQDLSADRTALEQALAKADADAAGDREKIAVARETLAAAENEANEIATELVLVQSQLEAQQTDNRIFREERLVQARQLLERGKAETQALTEELAALETQLSASKEERAGIGEKINEINTLLIVQQKLLEEKKQEHDRKAAERDELNAQVRRMTAGIDGLLEEINKRTEQLEGMDKEKIEADLRQDQAALQEQIEALEQTRQQSQALREEITQKTAEVEAARTQLEELTAQKAGQDKIYGLLERNIADLREKLAALDEPDCRERVERSRNQVQILHRIRTSLEENAAQIGCGWSFDLPKDLIAQIQSAEKTLQTLQTAIQEYTALRQSELTT